MHITIPEILRGEREYEAADRINYYFTELTKKHRPLFSGSAYDGFAPDENPEDAFTAADFLSTGLLGVHVPGKAIVKFLTDERFMKELEGLLRLLPANVDLGDLDKEHFDQLMGKKGSHGYILWDVIRGNSIPGRGGKDYVGMGETLTSKLLARKRPRLIPIWDSRIERQLNLSGSKDHWNWMWEAVTDDGGELNDRLRRIREKSGQKEISLLRTFDVAVWHFDKYKKWSRPATSSELEPNDDSGQIGDAADDVPDAEPQQK
ncbi:DUF6308 family protein [Brachybacterium paraconglomeratum]|uniref:DUF6308 family protein n=1 Tax=Brachybacterium paraconglomeratum TaxID=173362 RepID=UPI003F7C9D68